jgi:hypothetical protein
MNSECNVTYITTEIFKKYQSAFDYTIRNNTSCKN